MNSHEVKKFWKQLKRVEHRIFFENILKMSFFQMKAKHKTVNFLTMIHKTSCTTFGWNTCSLLQYGVEEINSE